MFIVTIPPLYNKAWLIALVLQPRDRYEALDEMEDDETDKANRPLRPSDVTSTHDTTWTMRWRTANQQLR